MYSRFLYQCVKCGLTSFIGLCSGVNIIKLFFLLTLFINIGKICCIAVKRFSLQEREIKFTAKKFFEIDPRGLHCKTFYRHYLQIFVIS